MEDGSMNQQSHATTNYEQEPPDQQSVDELLRRKRKAREYKVRIGTTIHFWKSMIDPSSRLAIHAVSAKSNATSRYRAKRASSESTRNYAVTIHRANRTRQRSGLVWDLGRTEVRIFQMAWFIFMEGQSRCRARCDALCYPRLSRFWLTESGLGAHLRKAANG